MNILDFIDVGIPLICVSNYETLSQSFYSLQEFIDQYRDEPLVGFSLKNLEKKIKVCVDNKDIFDIKFIYNTDESLEDLFNKNFNSLSDVCILKDLKQRFNAVLRACKNSKIDYRVLDIRKIIPMWMIKNIFAVRARFIKSLFENKSIKNYNRKFVQSLILMELNGIYKKDNSFSFTNFSVVKAKTGRMRIDGGFNCHGIKKKKEVRQNIISRYGEDGLICSIDYNAIDYRNIIHSVKDEWIKSCYSNSDDFHKTTAQLLLNRDFIDTNERNIVKRITYSYLYGSSLNNIIALYPNYSVKELLDKFKETLRCVIDLQEQKHMEFIANGFLVTPMGSVVSISDSDHKGKLLGLYAQTFSSDVFEIAFIHLTEKLRDMKTKLIFHVHDEFVLDIHKDEIEYVKKLSNEIECLIPKFKFKVSTKFGKDYYEASMM